MDGLAGVRQRFTALEQVLDEKSRRLLAAAESKVWGAGGISAVSNATGVSRQVIRQGLRELEEAPTHAAGRIRRVGGGRKKAKHKDPTLVPGPNNLRGTERSVFMGFHMTTGTGTR